MNIGFAGVGNMASAIINGLLQHTIPGVTGLHAYSPSGAKSAFESCLTWHSSNKELANAVDIIVIGVKPHLVTSVLADIQDTANQPMIVSLAAGVTTSTIEAHTASKTAVIRTMPNTPSAINAGMTGLFHNHQVTEQQKQIINALFLSIGEVLWLNDESKFHVLTAISGSGPAYFFQFTDALIKAGIDQGLTAEEAAILAVQTAKGAGLLMSKSGKTPAQLQKEVTSPNGTTAAATNCFQKDGLFQLVDTAVSCARQRSIELSEGR